MSRAKIVGAFLATVLLCAGVLYSRSIRNSTVSLKDQIEFKDSASAVMAGITANLRNDETCTFIMSGQSAEPGKESAVFLNYVYDSSLTAETSLRAGAKVFPGAIIEHLGLALGSPDMRLKVQEFGSYLTRYPASLRLMFRSQDGKIRVNWSERGIDKYDLGVKFFVWLDRTNKIVSCFRADSAAAFCNMTNGYYVDQRCRQGVQAVSPFAADPANETGFGTCRYGGLRAPDGCEPPRFSVRTEGGNCFTGKCLPARDMCLRCE